MWTLDYEADIASDLSVFHRVDDPMTLDGPTYFERAVRLSAYSGVLAARAAQAQEDERTGRSSSPTGRTASAVGVPAGRDVEIVDDTAGLAMLVAEGWAEDAARAREATPEEEV